jgi:hypothetical protein
MTTHIRRALPIGIDPSRTTPLQRYGASIISINPCVPINQKETAMTRGIIRRRIIEAAAVVAVAAASISFGAARAGAVQCCGSAIIDNLTHCTFWVCIDDGTAAGRCYEIGLASNILWFSGECFDETQFHVRDVWGTQHMLPQCNGCWIDVQVTAACCVRISRQGNCTWEVNYC